jgi:hypothetical protein
MSISEVRVVVTSLLVAGLLPLWCLAPSLAAEEVGGDQPIFYPQPPNQPRIQFLKAYSSSLDLASERKGFRDFVFGGSQNERQLLEKPYGLAVYNNSIFVTDARGNGYGIFDLANEKARLVQPQGAGALSKPINITIDVDGTRFVTDTNRNQIMVYDVADRFIRAIGTKDQFKPIDVAIKGDKLYVSDILNMQVVILDKATGEELSRFGGRGAEEGTFLHPTNLAFGPNDTLIVTDTGNFRLQEFDFEGNFIRSVGSVGNRPGNFSRPKGVAVDKDGIMYVVDSAFENVQILDAHGGALMAFGSPGAGPGTMNLPTVVKIDYDNVRYFEHLIAPGFEVEYLLLVASQFGDNKVAVFGYGSYEDQ